jgi:two-component system OmpR family sensor kinase
MSIRIRLTLWYTAVLAGILLAFGVIVFRIFISSQDSEINRTLEEVARDLQGTSAAELPILLANRRIVVPRLNTFSLSTIYVQVWDAQGSLQARSDNIAGYVNPLDPQALEEDAQQRRIRNVPIEEAGTSLRVLTLPLATVGTDAQFVGWLQIATSLDTVISARQKLLSILIQGSIVGVLLSSIMGALLARRALRPIHAITQTAVQITRADDLGRRIPHVGPPDEVGQLAGAFNEMLERLESIFHAQRRFVADVSHELRTPLTTIRGNVDLLRRMGGNDPPSISAIENETDRMIRLVGDLLLLAKADAGHLPIDRKPVEIDALMAEIADQTRVLAGEHLRVTLECPEMGDTEPLIVLGDADRLRQLLLNLADNAIKHTPDGGAIFLRLIRMDGWVRLTMTDTGSGIPPEDLPHIFDRFYRAEKSRWRKLPASASSPGVGVGLGLSIARWIAEAHGGHIEVQSEQGKGSAFHVWLPLNKPDTH